MTADVETMFSAKETPWHKLGVVTEDVLTASDALKVAELDWEVELKDMFTKSSKSDSNYFVLDEVPDKFAVIRSSDSKCFGVVGNRYTPVQNVDAFTYMDNLVDSGDAKYETAGALNGGATIFILMKLEKALPIEDEVNPYLLLTNSHDGSGALKVMMTPVRVVCSNTLRMALRDKTQNVYSIRHTSSIHGKIDEGRKMLGIADMFYDSFSAEVNALMDKEITKELFQSIMDNINPYPALPTEHGAMVGQFPEEMKKHARQEKAHEYIKEAVSSNFEHEANKNGFGYTGWSLLNAWNSYELWEKNRRGVKTNKMLLEKQAKELVAHNSKITDDVKEMILNGS